MNYIVELQKGCWIAQWSGDPGRTLVKTSARVYKDISRATYGLAWARRFSPFKKAKIVEVVK